MGVVARRVAIIDKSGPRGSGFDRVARVAYSYRGKCRTIGNVDGRPSCTPRDR